MQGTKLQCPPQDGGRWQFEKGKKPVDIKLRKLDDGRWEGTILGMPEVQIFGVDGEDVARLTKIAGLQETIRRMEKRLPLLPESDPWFKVEIV